MLYGFNHQRAISASDRQIAAKKEYEHKAKLISDAKAEFQRKNNPETLPKGSDKGKGFDCTLFWHPIVGCMGSGHCEGLT